MLQHISVHLLVHGAVQHKQLTFATIVKSSPWQMDWHYHLFPAHRHQRASHSAAYTPELVHLCDATWILTRQWRYNIASDGCPKHDDVLPTDVSGAEDTLKSWASYQIRKIAGGACAGNARNDFPATDFKGNRYLAIPACITARASRTCRDACRDRLTRGVGGKVPGIPGACATGNFTYLVRGPFWGIVSVCVNDILQYEDTQWWCTLTGDIQFNGLSRILTWDLNGDTLAYLTGTCKIVLPHSRAGNDQGSGLPMQCHVNLLVPRQNGRHFADDISKCIFVN